MTLLGWIYLSLLIASFTLCILLPVLEKYIPALKGYNARADRIWYSSLRKVGAFIWKYWGVAVYWVLAMVTIACFAILMYIEERDDIRRNRRNRA